MLVPTMTLPEMITEARRDHGAMGNKVAALLPKLWRTHLRDRKKELSHQLPWRSPRGNQWLLHLSIRKSGLSLHPLVWTYDRKGRIFALVVTPTGVTYHLENHMLQRYGERFDPTKNPLERLQAFYRENHDFATETRGERRPGVQEAQVGMNHGLGLGEWDVEQDIVHVRTFVSFGQLFPGQLALMERLDAQRAWDNLTLGQQQERLRKAQPQEDLEKAA